VGREGRIGVMLGFPGEMRGAVMMQVTEHLQTRGVPFEHIAH
jgi:hypothetical protein